MNPGPPALEASTIPLGYRGGGIIHGHMESKYVWDCSYATQSYARIGISLTLYNTQRKCTHLFNYAQQRIGITQFKWCMQDPGVDTIGLSFSALGFRLNSNMFVPTSSLFNRFGSMKRPQLF